MPALEALLPRFEAAHTQPLGVSIDSIYSHAAWAHSLGGISLPLLADFHPKGELAKSLGLYLADNGITDRATVLIDANGKVCHVSSVGPGGKRDIAELAALCEDMDKGWDLPEREAAPGVPAGTTLYVKDNCMFSRWALAGHKNLHLEDTVAVKNVSTDDAARAELEARGGKTQAPALFIDGAVRYESDEIISELVSRTSVL